MRSSSALLVAGILLAGGAAPAFAQDVSSSQKPKSGDAAVLSGDKLPDGHALGDWGGVRTTLADHGVDLGLSYLSETAGVVSGGRRSGVDYAHSINLKVDTDMAKLAGVSGFSLHGAVIERAGRNTSRDYLGERLTEVQEIYGGGGDVAAHLAYLYGEEKLAGGVLDVEAGRLDVGQDFATSPLYCEFMTLSVCPSDRALTLQGAFTIFPAATWGARLKVQPPSAGVVKTAYLQLGAYQVRPEDGGRSGFDFSTSDTTGAIIPVELGTEPQFGPDKLIGHYKLGAVYDTSSYPDLYEDEAGGALAASGRTGREHRGRASFYVLADQMVMRTGKNGTDGVIVLGGYTRADPHTAVISDLGFLGVLASGIVPGRPHDSIGAQVVRFKVSDQLEATQRLEAALGAPLTDGLSGALAGAPAGVQGEQTTLEGRYDVDVAEGVHVMPDFQYVMHPDGARRYPDAAVLAVRLSLTL